MKKYFCLIILLLLTIGVQAQKIEHDLPVYMNDLPTTWAPTDSILVIASDGEVKTRPASSISGGGGGGLAGSIADTQIAYGSGTVIVGSNDLTFGATFLTANRAARFTNTVQVLANTTSRGYSIGYDSNETAYSSFVNSYTDVLGGSHGGSAATYLLSNLEGGDLVLGSQDGDVYVEDSLTVTKPLIVKDYAELENEPIEDKHAVNLGYTDNHYIAKNPNIARDPDFDTGTGWDISNPTYAQITGGELQLTNYTSGVTQNFGGGPNGVETKHNSIYIARVDISSYTSGNIGISLNYLGDAVFLNSAGVHYIGLKTHPSLDGSILQISDFGFGVPGFITATIRSIEIWDGEGQPIYSLYGDLDPQLSRDLDANDNLILNSKIVKRTFEISSSTLNPSGDGWLYSYGLINSTYSGDVDLVLNSGISITQGWNAQIMKSSDGVIRISGTATVIPSQGVVINKGEMATITYLGSDTYSVIKSSNSFISDTTLQMGIWNMDSNNTKSVAHGLSSTEWKTIKNIKVVIENDDVTQIHGFTQGVYVTSSNIVLTRATGGTYDNTSFNDSSKNRGVITFQYTPD